MSAPIAFNAAPLTAPVTRQQVKEFLASRPDMKRPGRSTAIVVGVLTLVFTVPLLVIPILVLGASAGQGGSAIVPLSMVLVFLVAIGAAVGLLFGGSKVANEQYRLAHFAAANGMTYHDHFSNPGLPGMIFGLGGARLSTNLVRGHTPRFVEFGNYQYTTGSGKNQTTHNWGYVAVKLDVPLPHIVLDAKGNNSFFGSNLPMTFTRDQHLRLEGNFNELFSLYCPREYEADALYLFTPDIMARFIDHAAELDVEIVDDWLFLYAKRPLSTTDAATWAWLFATVGSLLTKFDQWARWRDERLRMAPPAAPGLPFAPPQQFLAPPPGVAPPGQRLKKKWAWWVAIPFIILLFLPFMGFLVSVLARH